MFDQESLKYQEPTPVLEEGDLFHGYEVKTWELTPRIYKIIGASVLANLLFFTVIAQTDVLTMRGCQSPFVGRVCQVLDMAYVGTVLFGTEREYVDMAYEKTDLGDAEITFVSMDRSEPRFEYPSGYFQLANPEQFVVDPAAQFGSESGFGSIAPGIPSNPTMNNDLASRPQRLPKKIKDPVEGNVGNPWADEEEAGGTQTPKPNDSKPDDQKVADAVTRNANANVNPTLDPAKPEGAVTINREPMRIFGKEVAEKIDNKVIDVSKNFKVTAVAVLDANGRMDVTIDKKTKLQKSRILSAEGDPEMIKVVSAAIAAVGDSGWLGYLRNEGIEKLNFTFSQDDNALVVDIASEQLTPERANTIASKLRSAIAGAQSGASLAEGLGMKKLDDDSKALLQAASATSNGKTVLVNFKLPKPAAQEMIMRNVNKARESETGKKSNGQIGEGTGDRNRSSR